MKTFDWPVGEYVRGDTLPPVCIEVKPKVSGLWVDSARLHFRPTAAAGQPAIAFDSAATAEGNKIAISDLEGGGQVLFVEQVDTPPSRLGTGIYTGDLEVVFNNGFRKTLFRTTLTVLDDFTR